MNSFPEIQRWAGLAAPWLMWGGAAGYLFGKKLGLNAIPWIVWTIAAAFAAFNTVYVERGISIQSVTFSGLAILYPAVIFRHRKSLVFSGLPRWQKAALPLLIASPVISAMFTPYWGILAQVVFSTITAAAFCQTAFTGRSEESAFAWTVETVGGGLLAVATFHRFPQSLYTLSGFLISAACLSCILAGRWRGGVT